MNNENKATFTKTYGGPQFSTPVTPYSITLDTQIVKDLVEKYGVDKIKKHGIAAITDAIDKSLLA